MAQRKARWTSNPKVVGSNPTKDVCFGSMKFFLWLNFYIKPLLAADNIIFPHLKISALSIRAEVTKKKQTIAKSIILLLLSLLEAPPTVAFPIIFLMFSRNELMKKKQGN